MKFRTPTAADLEHLSPDLRIAVDVSDLRVYDGDLVVEGNLVGGKPPMAGFGSLMVLGDLTVKGTVGLDEGGSLVVTGALRCRNLYCIGNLNVVGPTTVDECVFGFYEAGISCFDDVLRTKVFLQGDHSFELNKVEAGTHLVFSNYQELTEGTEEEARAALTNAGYAAVSELMGLSDDEPEVEFVTLMLRGSVVR